MAIMEKNFKLAESIYLEQVCLPPASIPSIIVILVYQV